MVVKTDEQYAELVSTLDFPLQETTAYDKWQKALADELGMRYSDELAGKTWEGVTTLYERMPEAGISYERLEVKWGYQSVYRSTSFDLTGQKAGTFLAFEKVKELLRE